MMALCNLRLRLQLWLMVAGVGVSAQNPLMPRETNSCMERNQPGLICETCELLATCVKVSSGWLTVPVETCETERGYYCNANIGNCSNVTGPCHPFGYEGNFVCTSQGVFPDPYDCQKYHMCYVAGTTLVSANIECGGDKAYNVVTGECTLAISDVSCSSKQYECANVGDAGAWPRNNNLFYICKATTSEDLRVLYPTLYRCGPNEVFDGKNCVSGGQGSVTSKPNNPSIMPSEGNSSDDATTPGQDEKCTKLGLQQDPLDCRSYYYCSGLRGTLKHSTCPKGSYYNSELSSCTIGIC